MDACSSPESPPDSDSGAPEPDATVRPALSAVLWTLAAPTAPDGAPPDPAILRPYLSASEWARVAAFRDPDHAWSSAAARALLRAMLARYHGAHPLAWHFVTEPGGRPHVDMDRPPHPLTAETRPRFSLSHTRGLAACAVSIGPWPAGAEVGVDVEWTARAVLPATRLARRFFHPAEARALEQVADDSARQDLFLTLWTRKEAVLKALGLGIANHLALYSCLGEPARVQGPPDVIGHADQWHMDSGDASPRHRLSWAVCAPWRAPRPAVRIASRHLTTPSAVLHDPGQKA